jgi:hypothetical protein
VLVRRRRRGPGSGALRGEVKPVAHHIIDMVRRLYRAYLVVMSYRNQTGGPDGSIALARGELDYAAGLGASCGLVVGQQYGDVEPDAITEAFSGYPAVPRAGSRRPGRLHNAKL